MRDKSHEDFIVRWANFVKNDKTRSWKKFHTEFINAQFQKREEFFKRLEKEPGGKEKIRQLKKFK